LAAVPKFRETDKRSSLQTKPPQPKTENLRAEKRVGSLKRLPTQVGWSYTLKYELDRQLDIPR
jgi:hypothetical protein